MIPEASVLLADPTSSRGMILQTRAGALRLVRSGSIERGAATAFVPSFVILMNCFVTILVMPYRIRHRFSDQRFGMLRLP